MIKKALIKLDIAINNARCLKIIWAKYYQVYTLYIAIRIKDNELFTIFKDQ